MRMLKVRELVATVLPILSKGTKQVRSILDSSEDGNWILRAGSAARARAGGQLSLSSGAACKRRFSSPTEMVSEEAWRRW